MSRYRLPVIVSGLIAFGALSTPAAGRAERLIRIESGTLPILITAPHGGTHPIAGVPPREPRPDDRVNLRRDELTNRLAAETAGEVERLLGQRPYLVVAEFSRDALDANRPAETAFQHPAAEPVYREYHDAVGRYSREIVQRWPSGLLLDLHAQWAMPEVIMRGTRDGQTIQRLLRSHGWDGLTGPRGLLGTLEQEGLHLFPSTTDVTEGAWTHAGSYTASTYARLGIDALQLEIGSSLCDSEEDVRLLAPQLARGIQQHLVALQQAPAETSQTSPASVSPPAAPAVDVPLSEAEQAFVDLMTNCVLVGRFSVDGRQDREPRPERYAISGVRKVADDNWIVQSRITYGDIDVPVPVPVKVHWAGDTPMISVTDLAIPLVGQEFTARVMFYRDRYAGTWYHGKAGGHMWGKIEKAPPPDSTPPDGKPDPSGQTPPKP
jgi:N-formylglutamate amidohydrolase